MRFHFLTNRMCHTWQNLAENDKFTLVFALTHLIPASSFD